MRRVVCTNFDTLPYLLNSWFTHFSDAVLHATKIIKSPFKSWNNFKTDSPFTIVENFFFICKNLYFSNDEVRAGCPKLNETPYSIGCIMENAIGLTVLSSWDEIQGLKRPLSPKIWKPIMNQCNMYYENANFHKSRTQTLCLNKIVL